MIKTEVVTALNKVRDAMSTWQDAHVSFRADATAMTRRLVMEGAVNYMSTDEIAREMGVTERQVRALLRNEGLDPRMKKPQLAKHSARVLSDNAALLGIEPAQMDLMSPLAYLPAGDALRRETDGVSKVTEVDTLGAWLYERFAAARFARPTEWSLLSLEDRQFWDHEADAVRRAVERGGFKA